MNGTPELGFAHVYQPPAGDDATTLLLLHGTGGDEHDLLQLVPALLPNAGVLSPRGKVLEGGMPRFFRRLAPGVFDLEDLARRTGELRDFIDAAANAYGFPREHVVAVGLSNGANIAANLLLSFGGVLQHAVLFRGMPVRPDAEARIPPEVGVYMASGRRDRLVAPDVSEALAAQLRNAGATVTLAWDEGGHELTRQAIDGARSWLQQRTAPS